MAVPASAAGYARAHYSDLLSGESHPWIRE
jgi:hypothetical protein